MSGKRAFLLYTDLCAVFGELTDEQAGQIIKEIVNYANSKTEPNQEKPSGLSGLLKALSTPFKNHIDRDFAAWEHKAEIGRNNGKLGGRPKAEITQANLNNPDEPVKVKVKVKDKVKDIEEKNIKKENLVLPRWINQRDWDDFCEIRKAAKKPLSDISISRIIEKLKKFNEQGQDVSEILNQSIMNNWAGVFPLKQNFARKPEVKSKAVDVRTLTNQQKEAMGIWIGK
jgi:hypothetical protein